MKVSYFGKDNDGAGVGETVSQGDIRGQGCEQRVVGAGGSRAWVGMLRDWS